MAGESDFKEAPPFLDEDTLVQCAGKIESHRDLCNMAACCKCFKEIAYHEPLWRSLYRRQWPTINPLLASRAKYVERFKSLSRFRHGNPDIFEGTFPHLHPHHLTLTENGLALAQKGVVYYCDNELFMSHGRDMNCFREIGRHREIGSYRNTVCCMRSYSGTLVSSGGDGKILTYAKGTMMAEPFLGKGHDGPVLTLSDRSLGDGNLFCSGGSDQTVRVWNLNSKKFESAFYGHNDRVSKISVPGYNNSHVVSVSNDANLKLWDVEYKRLVSHVDIAKISDSEVRARPSVMQCYESASGSESMVVVGVGDYLNGIDLRNMEGVSCYPLGVVHSLSLVPSKSLVCVGSDLDGVSKLDVRMTTTSQGRYWVRKYTRRLRGGYHEPVSHLYADGFKIIAAGRNDSNIFVWDVDTNEEKWALQTPLFPLDEDMLPDPQVSGCLGLAIDGFRMAVAGTDRSGDLNIAGLANAGRVAVSDFTNCIHTCFLLIHLACMRR